MRDLESDHRDSDGVISFKAAAELIEFAEFRGRTGRLLSSSDSQEGSSPTQGGSYAVPGWGGCIMSLDTESNSPTIRDHLEASYASHTPSPDIDSIVSGAVEQRDREVRTRDRAAPLDHHEYEGASKDRLRSTIRGAIHETKLKVATGPTQPLTKHEALAGPPPAWDLDAKAAWHELPEPVRLAVQREQAEAMNGIETKIAPHLREHAEIKQVLAPARERYQQHGLRSDAEAVHRLVSWEAAIANPQTRVQSIAEIMMQNGVTVHDLFALAGAPQQYQQYAQHYGGDPVAQQHAGSAGNAGSASAADAVFARQAAL